MIKQPLFRDGVNAVLVTKWKLRLETPLCIKNNSSSAFNPTDGEKKTRNYNMSFGWNRLITGDEVQVSDAHFGIHIKDGRVFPGYSIPAKSGFIINIKFRSRESRVSLEKFNSLKKFSGVFPAAISRFLIKKICRS